MISPWSCLGFPIGEPLSYGFKLKPPPGRKIPVQGCNAVSLSILADLDHRLPLVTYSSAGWSRFTQDWAEIFVSIFWPLDCLPPSPWKSFVHQVFIHQYIYSKININVQGSTRPISILECHCLEAMTIEKAWFWHTVSGKPPLISILLFGKPSFETPRGCIDIFECHIRDITTDCSKQFYSTARW